MEEGESQFTKGGTARGAYSPYSSVTPQTNQSTRNACAQHTRTVRQELIYSGDHILS